MAIETHGVTPSDVIDELGFADGTVTASSDGLSTTELDNWINRAAGRVNRVLDARSIPTDLTDAEEKLAESAIIAFAAWKAARKREFSRDMIDDFRTEWEGAFSELKTDQSSMGDTVDATAAIQTNVDTSTSKTATRFGTDFEM